jgi:Ca-activated chloride channel family protein
LAAITGGAYAPLGSSGQGLETLYRQHLAQLPRRTVEERMHKVYTERFQIPLAIAIGCLLLELTLRDRRRRREGVARAAQTTSPVRRSRDAVRSDRPIGAIAKGVAAAVALLLIAVPRPAGAATPAAPAASTYNDGTAAYRKKDFATARDRFQAATHTTDLPMQEDAYYDLANARYRLGQSTLAKDRPATIEAWKSAVAAYDGALALQPTDADARFNRDLVARRLAALEAQEQRDQQQKKQPDQKNQKNQKNQKAEQGKQSQPSSGGQQQGPQKHPGAQNGGGQPQPAQPAPSPQGGAKAPSSTAQEGNKQPQKSGNDQGRESKPEPTENQGAGIVSKAPGSQSAGPARAADARRAPGALTPSEAVQLLDSVSGELHRLPVADARRRQSTDRERPPLKDW